MLEELKKALENPDFVEKLKKDAELKNIIFNNDFNRIKKIFDDDDIFSKTLYKLIEKHGEDYQDKCYKKGYMPHPNNLLNMIINTVMQNCNRIEPVVECHFPLDTCFYRGFYFEIMYGQGSLLTIYDKDKRRILVL